jgi:hypothetical protein
MKKTSRKKPASPGVAAGADGSVFLARVIACEGPAFGAYLAGTAKDGEAVIFLNLLACLAVDRDPKKTAAETLAHEVLHACQEIMGEALTEADIQNAIARINGCEIGACETEEEVIQEATQQLQEALTEVERLRTALQEIADETQRHAEHNPVSGTARLPIGYERILNVADAALNVKDEPHGCLARSVRKHDL